MQRDARRERVEGLLVVASERECARPQQQRRGGAGDGFGSAQHDIDRSFLHQLSGRLGWGDASEYRLEVTESSVRGA
jgi:hypothetical protein